MPSGAENGRQSCKPKVDADRACLFIGSFCSSLSSLREGRRSQVSGYFQGEKPSLHLGRNVRIDGVQILLGREVGP